MNTRYKSISAGLLAAFLLTACGGGGDGGNGVNTGVGNGGPPLMVDADGVSTFDSTALGTSLAALPVETLSVTERESLLFMREEEKLAHDVYAGLDAHWGASLRVFGNIARSESTHTEAVRRLLLRYALPDPTASLAAGVYQNPLLQGLYTQLMVTGNVSLVDALKVGAAIEEIDMIDLNKALLSVDNQDIVLVYQNLLKGSRNHLRSFVSSLAKQGVTYTAQYMAASDYLAIVSTPMER